MKLVGATAVSCWLAVAIIAPMPVALGEEVLFVSDRDQPGNWDIYAIDVDTHVVRRLTTDPGVDNHPDRSEDGTKVVWSSTRSNGGANPEGDFEIFIATDDGTPNSLEAGSPTQLTSNDIPDRHPHFNHATVPADMRIIYSAKYICVETTTTIVSQCSIPATVIINPCGRKCEGMRVMNIDGTNVIDIDHDDLTAANPIVWPQRRPTDARWVGHPSFSHDDTKVLFSGAVDGEGRNWEVYVADWDGAVVPHVSNLRQVTLGSTYPPNDNPIRMSAGAHFSPDDANILFTSTRTEFGNSQLFEVPATANHVPVSAGNRYLLTSDRANDYVPEPLMDGRIVVTSDRDEFMSLLTCGTPPAEYTKPLNPLAGHTIRIEASGLSNPGSGGNRIHLDAYSLNGGASLIQETSGTVYGPGWEDRTSPNASDGHYRRAGGTGGEYVDIPVSPGTLGIKLYLGRTPSSGVARIRVDGVPITDGNFTLPGDVPPNKSGLDLYTPQLSTSNDLDLILIDPAGPTSTNLTDNDFADEMNLIGDEVSWFCGLSPNLSLCTYLPKYFTIGQLALMQGFGGFQFPTNFPSRDLYPIACQALSQFMMSNGNQLRSPNASSIYWQQIQQKMSIGGQYLNELVVLPTPVNFSVMNYAPNPPANPNPSPGAVVTGSTATLSVSTPSDPHSSLVPTTDIYLASGQGALVLVGKDLVTPVATVQDLASGVYAWVVDHKDSMGGRMYGQTWTFAVTSKADFDVDFDVDQVDFCLFDACFSGANVPLNPGCEGKDFNNDGYVDLADFGVFQRCFTGSDIAPDPDCGN